jgi:hypothetical protein
LAVKRYSKNSKYIIKKGKEPSPTMISKCPKCNKFDFFLNYLILREKLFPTSSTYERFSTFTNYIVMIFIVFIGDTYSRISGLFKLIGLNLGSKQYYHKQMTDLDKVVDKVTQNLLHSCRQQTPFRDDMFIMLDAGWSHPGWWARECTVIALDGRTGLPVEVYHVIRGSNYSGSSRGNKNIQS